MERSKLKNNQGFSLLEVLVATILFAVFITAFMSSQGTNVIDSIYMREETMMQSMADRVMNDFLLNPQSITANMDGRKEVKQFIEPQFQGYSYTVEYKKMVIPNIFQQLGSQTNSQQQNQQQNSSTQQIIFNNIKENLEKMIWQIRITITNKENGQTLSLGVWARDPQARMQIGGM